MSQQLIIRLDDASNKMDIEKWDRIEKILDSYNIKPIVGIIPINNDPDFQKYKSDVNFFKKVKKWQNKGWIIAMHGYQHVFETNFGGINPINQKSEFAGLDLKVQKEKIKKAYAFLKSNNINPTVFFAPAHTFDNNTLIALEDETDIRIISDTIANDIYYKKPFYFIPQQSGKVRQLPFKVVTFCYHPNNMIEKDFDILDAFLNKHKEKFHAFSLSNIKKRRVNLYDMLLRIVYHIKRMV